jgi:hypothetical protein
MIEDTLQIPVEERDVLAIVGSLTVENQVVKAAAKRLLEENAWLEMVGARLLALVLMLDHGGEMRADLPPEERDFLDEVRERLSPTNGGEPR